MQGAEASRVTRQVRREVTMAEVPVAFLVPHRHQEVDSLVLAFLPAAPALQEALLEEVPEASRAVHHEGEAVEASLAVDM